jgi:nitric oxide reductase activation protein
MDANRVRKFTNRPCLFVVLSDGQPAASCYSSEDHGIMETREAVNQISKQGFYPIQIGIHTHYDDNPMFKDWVQFSDFENMVNNVAKIVRDKIGKMIHP